MRARPVAGRSARPGGVLRHGSSWQRTPERRAKDEPDKASNVDPATSVLFTGKEPLDSDSAQEAADRQIRRAFAIADLGRELGFSAGSLRLWAAARHVTGFATLITGADVAGIDPLVLHRQLGRGTDRGRRP